MSAQQLITDHLDLWTSAVTHKRSAGRGSGKSGKIELTGIKKLRELILELAVRGKLVEQDPTDEPASVLLEKIADEKARLVKEGKIKKPRKLPPASDFSKPFTLAKGWVWIQLEDIGRDWGQKQPDRPFSYIDVSAIDNIKGRLNAPEILTPNEAPSRARKLVRAGTLIYSTVRPYLQNIAIIEDDIYPEPIASTAFAVVSPLTELSERYLLHYLRSPVFVRYVESVQTGIAYPAINDKQFFSGVLPLPPLNEQHRIVSKVDELMALCDRLEQQTGDQLDAHEVLVDTLLDALTRSADAAEVAENWTRIAEHFDTLFTTEASIDKLKQTILQLAVMGRLVEQDPNDEPASVLLEKIAEEKAKLVKEGKIKKSKKLPFPADQDEIFPLPNGWEWGSIASTGIASTGKTPSTKEQHFFDGEIPFIGPGQITASGHINQPEKFLSENGLLESEEALFNDIVVVCIGGSIGKCAKIQKRCGFNQQINKIRPILVHPDYLLTTLSTDFVYKLILNKSTGSATPIINRSKWQEICIPLPPINEQHRIVKKVDELMALCDQLKTRLSDAGETLVQLAEAVVKKGIH